MDPVDDDDTLEPRDWRAHPKAKPGAWSVELPLGELIGARENDDEQELIQSLLESLRTG